MGDDEPTSDGSDTDGDATVSLPRDALLPPPPAPDPLDMIERHRAAVPRSSPPQPTEPHGRGVVWIGVVLALVAVFVVACYLVVARAERDRGDGPSTSPSTTQPTTTTESTTTTVASPATHDPTTLTVAVLNGTEQVGWAGDNAETLSAAGFPTETTDALASPETTTVYVASEDLEPDAAAVAAALGLPDAAIELRPVEPLSASSIDQDVDIVVVLGADSLGG